MGGDWVGGLLHAAWFGSDVISSDSTAKKGYWWDCFEINLIFGWLVALPS